MDQRRIKYCITEEQAAEGRKRSLILPPMTHDGHTSYDAGISHEKNFLSSHNRLSLRSVPAFSMSDHTSLPDLQHEELHERYMYHPYHRTKTPVNRKIVKHLRRDLARRLERRMIFLTTASSPKSDVESLPDQQTLQKMKLKPETPRNIYHMYNEYGDKVVKLPKLEFHKSHNNNSIDTELQTPVWTSEHSDDDTDHLQEPLERETSLLSIGERRRSGFLETGPQKAEAKPTKEIEQNGHTESRTWASKVQIEEVEQKSSPEITVPYTELSVSPVPTPSVFRPQLAITDPQLTREQRISQILQGKLHLDCPNDGRIVRIYIHSCSSDTETERTALIQQSYLPLRYMCQKKGYDLQLLDLRWGTRDMLTDDHCAQILTQKIISKTASSPHELNFITFTSQKFGETVLPTSINKGEFEAILGAAEEDSNKMRAEIDKQAAVVEQTSQTVVNEGEFQAETQQKDSVDQEEATAIERKVSSKQRISWSDVRRKIEQLRSNIPDPDLLTTWYTLEENVVPPVYMLRKISSVYPDMIKGEASKRSQARSSWYSTAQQLRNMLQIYSTKVISKETSIKYRQPCALLELEEMMKKSRVPSSNMLWICREIEDIQEHMGDEKAQDFVDMVPMTTNLDNEKREALEKIKSIKLTNMLPVKNAVKYTISWGQNGVDPVKNRSHSSYLERLSRDFIDSVTNRLIKHLPQRGTNSAHERLQHEVLQHTKICQKWAREFHGRKELLVKTKQYLKSACRQPLVLYGRTGSGLTAVMSRIASSIYSWVTEKKTVVIFRSIGATPSSGSPRTLLHGLCLQLCEILNSDPSSIPEDFRGLQNEFEYRLEQEHSSKQIIILIDALHNFEGDGDERKPSWLPLNLPPQVKIIVSTAKEKQFPTLEYLQNSALDRGCFIELQALPEKDMISILKYWLSTANKSLTKKQFNFFCNQMCEYPVILHWKVYLVEALHWPCTLTTDQIKLPNNLKRLLGFVFARLEKEHGEILVKRAIGYITCARNGITENELVDLLSLDEAVMDEVSSNYKPSVRRFPLFYWLRLKSDLEEKVTECEMDNYTVLKWSHSVFEEVAAERYLNQRDKAPSYHKAMAEYFSGTWSHKPKPLPGTERGVSRYVSDQPLYREFEDHDGGLQRVFNLRRVNELPYHLLQSQQFELLKRSCLCNFEWMLAKICGTSIHSLFEDIQMALDTEPSDMDLQLVSDTIQLSRVPLSSEPKQLASQIVGRLQQIKAKDVPIAPADPLKYPYIHPLYDQAKKPSCPSLVPNVACLTEPGGILFDLLSGHADEITAVITCTNGIKAVTTSNDNTMKIWELRTGKVQRTINGVGLEVTSIRLGLNESLIITGEVGCLRIWELKTGKCLRKFDDYSDPPMITVAAEGQMLVAFFDGSGIMKVWDLANNISTHKEEKVLNANEIHQDRTFVVSQYTSGAQVLYAVRSTHEAIVRSASTGRVVRHLKCKEKSASVCALSGTREYWVVGIRCNFMQLHEIYALDIFDQNDGALLRTIRGCHDDYLNELHINAIGSHALTVCYSESSNSSNIAVWNIETEDHKHLAKHAAVSRFGACADLRYCLTSAKGENHIRIWNLSGKINIPMKRQKSVAGVGEILPMENPRYVLAKSKGTRALTVWNVLTGKCRGSAVRIARGLVDPSDILLIHKTLVVILAEKGFSESQKDRPLFQTVFIYDLKTKKYVRKLTDCYITPSPAHEYIVLDEENLMGLSDSRTHFVIWSLKTGHVSHRIKNNFTPLDISKEISSLDDTKITRKRKATAFMTPWAKRSETKTARNKRHAEELNEEKQKLKDIKKEKENSIDEFIISGNGKIVVASFFAHHLCVFDIEQKKHIQVLENPHSMLYLNCAALTYDGKYLVHPNYDDENKTSYVTMWNCMEGCVKKRLKNERNVCAVAASDDGRRVVIGKYPNELRIWEPGHSNLFQRARGHKNLSFDTDSKIYIIENGTRAAVFAGDVSVWDLKRASLLAVFTPDMKIQCFNIAMGGKLLVFGMCDSNDLVTLRLVSDSQHSIEAEGENVFGEVESSSSEEDEDEEEETEETKTSN